MKDTEAEALAQKQEDDLASLSYSPEFDTINGDERTHRKNSEPGKVHEHRLHIRPFGLVDQLFHPFSYFLSSHHGIGIDRENGTTVGIGIIRDAFEAFAPNDEQKALAAKLFDVAEKLGVDFRLNYRQSTDKRNEQAYELGGHITFHADELDKNSGEGVCDVILHEMAHGVTSSAIN